MCFAEMANYLSYTIRKMSLLLVSYIYEIRRRLTFQERGLKQLVQLSEQTKQVTKTSHQTNEYSSIKQYFTEFHMSSVGLSIRKLFSKAYVFLS